MVWASWVPPDEVNMTGKGSPYSAGEAIRWDRLAPNTTVAASAATARTVPARAVQGGGGVGLPAPLQGVPDADHGAGRGAQRGQAGPDAGRAGGSGRRRGGREPG